MRRTGLAIIAASLIAWCALAFPVAAQDATPEPPFTPAVPTLELPIPTLPSFSTLQVQGEGGNRYVDVPFVAEYIVALYRFSLGIIVTLAMVMIVIGGLRWVTAAGNAATIGSAKETVVRAVIGLLIAFGSYTILFLINPELVNFRSIRVDLVSKVDSPDSQGSETTIEGTGASTAPTGAPGPGTAADCIKLKQYLQEGKVSAASAVDHAGIMAIDASGNFIIHRSHAPWCYDNVSSSVTGGRSSTFDDPADGVHISPTICKLLTDLQDGLNARITIPCLICSHARCGKTHCEECVRDVTSRGSEGNPAWNRYQSEHWDGYGIDITGNLNDIQRYVVDQLAPRYGNIDKVIGPLGWDHTTITCDTHRPLLSRCEGQTPSPGGCPVINTNATSAEIRSHRASSNYTLINGRPGAYSGGDLCNHLDHVHVDFRH